MNDDEEWGDVDEGEDEGYAERMPFHPSEMKINL